MSPFANVLIGVIALTGAFHVWRQDLVTVAPDAAKIEYEDARVRVVRLRIAPNALVNIIVELKTADGPAKAAAGPATRRALGEGRKIRAWRGGVRRRFEEAVCASCAQ